MTKKTKEKKDYGMSADHHRPEEYTEEIADEIIARIVDGVTVRKITEDKTMPAWKTVWAWSNRHPSFRNRLVRARIDQTVSWADDIVAIAENCVAQAQIKVMLDDPELERIEEKGYVVFKYARNHAREARLLIDTKKWLMERLNSEQFGLKQYLDVTHTYMDAADEELIGELITAARRAGITPERYAEWYEEYKPEEE